MDINKIRSKIQENKYEKEKKLLETALELFTEKGIKKTSISDIVKKAGVAKGTFYLYFKDKYELENILLIKTSHELFSKAQNAANLQHFERLDDKIIFIIDYIINALTENIKIVRFLQKNLSLGLYSEKITDLLSENEMGVRESFVAEVQEKKIELVNPEITLYMIIELVSSTVCNAILEQKPLPMEQFKPYLYQTIRLMINEK